jgi:hypothetical protein
MKNNIRHTLWGSTLDGYLYVYQHKLELGSGWEQIPSKANVEIALELEGYTSDPRDGHILHSAKSVIDMIEVDWLDALDDPYQLLEIATDDLIEEDEARRYG